MTILLAFFSFLSLAANPGQAEWVSDDCQYYLDYLEETEINTPGFFSRFYNVPESPDGETQTPLFVYGKLVIEDGKVINPVLFINGGPGGSSHYSIDAFPQLYAHEKISLIFFDQRGTGCSESQRLNTANSLFIENMSDASPLKDIPLQYYGSRGIAGDIEFLRKNLLGDDTPWDVILGQSYGADIALRFAELFPGSAKHIIVHGASSYQSITELDIATLPELKKFNEEFFSQNPESRSQLMEIFALTDSSTCMYNLCGADVWDYLFGSYLGFRMYFEDLRQLIARIHERRDDLTGFLNELKAELGSYYFAHYVVATAVSNMEFKMALTPDTFQERLETLRGALGFDLFSSQSYQDIPIMPFRAQFSKDPFPHLMPDALDVSKIRFSELSLTVFASSEDIYTPLQTAHVFQTLSEFIVIEGDHDAFTSESVQNSVIEKIFGLP